MVVRGLIPFRRAPSSELRNQFDRVLENFFTDPHNFFTESWLPANGNARGEATFAPMVDVRETEEAIVVRAELPGVDAKDVELELVDDVLSIRGRKEERREKNEGGTAFSEFRYGSFHREIALPSPVDPDSVKAHCEKGILSVELKKNAENRKRKINVEAR